MVLSCSPRPLEVMLFKIWMHFLQGLKVHIGIDIPLSISVQSSPIATFILKTMIIRVVQSSQLDEKLQVFGHLNVVSLVGALVRMLMMQPLAHCGHWLDLLRA